MAGFAPLSFPRPPSPDPLPEPLPKPSPIESVPIEPARAPESPLEAAEPLAAIIPVATPGKRLEAALKAIRWTYGTLAVELHLSPSTTRNWGLGRAPVPPEILRWVELLAACHREHPAP